MMNIRKTDIKVRSYGDSDYSACRLLWSELTQHHRNIYEDPTIGEPDPGQGFEIYIALPNRKATWVAEVDGEINGFVGLLTCTWEGEAEIEPVIVSSNCRRRGIGTALVRHVIKEANKFGVEFLNVRPVARNRDAILFFAKLGFNTLGHIDLFQELNPSSKRKWETGITIHGKKLLF
ncbi:MAG TPA: GNAT family N-acetyltransferase [Dehalococcoidales bacterium]